MSEREEVLKRFGVVTSTPLPLPLVSMADRIVELEALAAAQRVRVLDEEALRDSADWMQRMVDASPCCESCDAQWRRRRNAILSLLDTAALTERTRG